MDPYLRTWKVKQVLLLLLQVASLSSCNQTLLPIYPCNSSPTSLGTTHGTEGTVRPTWIDPTLSQVGLLQTPNFPRPFALPLECLWIFDLTGLSRQAKTNYLHFYFTQFYLEDNILNVTSLSSPVWPLKGQREVLNWTEVDSLGNWSSAGQMQSVKEDTYILLKMKANSQSYDRLHKRVLEVRSIHSS